MTLRKSLRPWRERSGYERAAAIVLSIVLVLAFGIRCQLILDNSPYPQHVDEEVFVQHSLTMVKTGTLEPLTLNWPTLSIYLAAAAEYLGYLWERAAGRVPERHEIRTGAFPAYANPNLVLPARFLFAALSVATLLMVALIAWRISGSPLVGVLAPLVLSMSPLYLKHSWRYLNVDIAGTFFVVLGIAYLIGYADDRNTLLHKAVIPGVICGLAAACKYTHGAIALPFLISIALADWKKLFVWGPLLFVFLGLAFAIAVPYGALDPEELLVWIARQQATYSTGWAGYSVEPGIPNLIRQMWHLIESYGAVGFVLGIFGIVHALLRRGRKGIELAPYPIVFTLYFCMYRMDLPRNLLPVYAIFAVFVALGSSTLIGALGAALRKLLPQLSPRKAADLPAVLLVGAALSATAPWQAMSAAYFATPDSRNLTVPWIRENIPAGSRIVIAKELHFELSELKKDYVVSSAWFARSPGFFPRYVAPPRRLLRTAEAKGAYFIVPEYGRRKPGQEGGPPAEELNARYPGGEILAEFGSHPVPVAFVETAPDGDPRFSIRRGNILAD